MKLPPTAWNEYETAQFRLAGFGGAAIFIRSGVVPGALVGAQQPVMVMDIGFLSPASRQHVLARPVDPDLPERLSRFLYAAAVEFHPEQSLSPLQDHAAGLLVTIDSSDGERVALDWQLVENLDADVREFEGLNFETSRAALVTASQEALLLSVGAAQWPGRMDV